MEMFFNHNFENIFSKMHKANKIRSKTNKYEKNIKNYRVKVDVTSKQLKEKII